MMIGSQAILYIDETLKVTFAVVNTAVEFNDNHILRLTMHNI